MAEGSSPLTRGKPGGHSCGVSFAGLIPAHAGKTRWARQRLWRSWAHPRSRGENDGGQARGCLYQGSSPLTRGKRARNARTRSSPGLIPAHAGKTPSSVVESVHSWAHPRSRGENATRPTVRCAPQGSSPLTRGKPHQKRVSRVGHGLIPAHAGKTGTLLKGFANDTAHPRSRGENVPDSGLYQRHHGSSPLTRGKRPAGWWGLPVWGLIPAHAGKTRLAVCFCYSAGAHPRSRGENHTGRWAGRGLQGSSPLTRGKHGQERLAVVALGLIPAHAGKTWPPWWVPSSPWAHPRSRGENVAEFKILPLGKGSSPLTRGKPQHVTGDRLRDGLIPAHAGKTWSGRGRNRSCPAHPRSRGENLGEQTYNAIKAGSSPLTRGKLQHRRVGHHGGGLIPAHAGKTRTRRNPSRTPGAHPRSRGENVSQAPLSHWR